MYRHPPPPPRSNLSMFEEVLSEWDNSAKLILRQYNQYILYKILCCKIPFLKGQFLEIVVIFYLFLIIHT